MMKIGIALIPNQEMIASIIQLQQKVADCCILHPQLGTDINLPHITLLQGRFAESVDLIEVVSDTHQYFLEGNYSLEVRLQGIKYVPLGWYFLQPHNNPLFADTHQFVFERLKDCMVVTDEDKQKDISRSTLLEQSNYLNYGYRFIGQAFEPHITLGRTVNNLPCNHEEQLRLIFESSKQDYQGTIQRITVYKMGINGSHAETLYEMNK
ncbi:MAG: hypothetical protein QNJ63_02125 [Calothrix sp. MO_192.B10]|nr:hypothetical protein [Calothrix sp. MO_192.B10]